jgi:GNAT superfamily N-acetyltransferase
MKIEIQSSPQMSEDERKHMDAWLEQAFGCDDLSIEWAKDDWSVLVRLDDQIVCHVGIGGVATRVEYRKRGLAQAAMERAAEFMRDELGVEFGLLVCSQPKVAYYGKLGWHSVPGPLMFDQPKGKVTFGDQTKIMILPCTRKDWPQGAIDLCGPPW